MSQEPTLAHYEASVGSLGSIRHLVSDAVTSWGLDELLDDAVLCASELASNAILHTRLPFAVEISPLEGGLRIEVFDQRPRELPSVVPATGVASDITRRGTTGRGLLIVATIADRWGATASGDRKSVWAELRPGGRGERIPPVIHLADTPAAPPSMVHLHFLSLPVRAAVASGMHLDGLVREVQLGVMRVEDETAQRLYQLLDASAGPRLEGRRRALDAASQDEERYDLDLDTTIEALRALGKLNELMALIALDRRDVDPGEEVAAFRAWLGDETARQLRGGEPVPCPLP